MTVLLMLLFITIMLSAEAIVRYRKQHHVVKEPISVRVNGIIQEFFHHDELGLTMADGGTKIKDTKDGNTDGTQIQEKRA